MLSLSTLFTHSLVYGLAFSALMTALILVTLYLRPMIWIGDAPDDIQAVAGPMSDSDRQFKRVAGFVTFLILITLFSIATVDLARLYDGITFIEVAISTFIIFMTFNLIDLLVIDWLLVVYLRPQFVMIPGTEHLAGYQDYGFHLRAFLKGTIGGLALSVIVATVSVGVGILFP
jgi:hypothetical protein